MIYFQKPQKNLHSKKELYLNKLLNEKLKLNKIISNYKFGIIFFILMLIISVIYNNLKVKSLFQVNIVLEKIIVLFMKSFG